MKELSIEEKAKRYDEAIKIAKEINNEQRAQPFNVMTRVFPELKGSEDERIRKDLLQFLNAHIGCSIAPVFCTQHIIKWIEWIEKQGEQKPVDFSDLRTWKYIVDAVWTEKEGIGQYLDSPFTEDVAKKLQKRFGHIKQPKQEWSEEDEKGLGDALWCCKQAASIAKDENDMGNAWYAEKWLKSLKDRVQPQPQSHWKPTENQMKALRWLIDGFKSEDNMEYIKSLYSDLKAL